ncbi:MAG: type II secretion system protein [Akkermansiaceae bacterium]|nr:type II secretion system protein [Akkermansiaceae bacterium]NNM29493.1 type II secretion system protein [Akkermansiaceae bacterium]
MRQSMKQRGFTLMESVIAIAVVAVMLTTFLAVFGPASQGINAALSVQEADRLASTLERELQSTRDGDGFDTSFEKAYAWIRGSASSGDADTGGGVVLLYNYRGDPSDRRGDGSMQPFTEAGGVAGEDFILQSAVRRKDDLAVPEDLDAAEGRIFAVQMTQLVFDADGKLVLGEPGKIIDPNSPDGSDITDPDQYPEAVIAVRASFYTLPANDWKNYVKDFKLELEANGNAKNIGAPLFTRNLGVRR